MIPGQLLLSTEPNQLRRPFSRKGLLRQASRVRATLSLLFAALSPFAASHATESTAPPEPFAAALAATQENMAARRAALADWQPIQVALAAAGPKQKRRIAENYTKFLTAAGTTPRYRGNYIIEGIALRTLADTLQGDPTRPFPVFQLIAEKLDFRPYVESVRAREYIKPQLRAYYHAGPAKLALPKDTILDFAADCHVRALRLGNKFVRVDDLIDLAYGYIGYSPGAGEEYYDAWVGPIHGFQGVPSAGRLIPPELRSDEDITRLLSTSPFLQTGAPLWAAMLISKSGKIVGFHGFNVPPQQSYRISGTASQLGAFAPATVDGQPVSYRLLLKIQIQDGKLLVSNPTTLPEAILAGEAL